MNEIGIKALLCQNKFCIYWSNNECLLNKISLDIQGNCEDCIYVNIDESILKDQREKLLSKYDDE